jgi:micrococcal nuclease
MLAAAGFALGILAATTVPPIPIPSVGAAPVPPPSPAALRADPAAGLAFPAEVIRVLDGDTLEARVRVWPGLDITTKVRLRGIDAPEMRARCADERSKAEAARDALSALLARGRVTITHVSLGKYGGRVLAEISVRDAGNVAEALLTGGHVRRYSGGRWESWCSGRGF